MFDFQQWQSVNDKFLGQSLDWVRTRLQLLVDSRQNGCNPSYVTPFPQAPEGDFQPAIELLAHRFGLSDFEKQLILLCAAVEFDTRICGTFATVQGSQCDSLQNYPTFGLCFTVLDNPAWDVMSASGALRRNQLIKVRRLPNVPLTASPVWVPDRIVNYIKGLNQVDDSLLATSRPVHSATSNLPKTQQLVIDSAVDSLLNAAVGGDLPTLQLLGTEHDTKHEIAHSIAERIDTQLYRLPVDSIPTSIESLAEFAGNWNREFNLTPIAIFIEASEVSEPAVFKNIQRFVSMFSGVVLCDFVEKQKLRSNDIVIDVVRPTIAEQQTAWMDEQLDLTDDEIGSLIGQFDLSNATIEQIAEQVRCNRLNVNQSIQKPFESVWQSCRAATRPTLDELAQRIDTKATWDEIVLPDEELALLHQIGAQVRNRGKVLDDWGFRNKVNRGLGVTALFSGESGTGKTMAAEVIANELQLDLYRIDLATVINKYIGETEKNLRKLFDAAENGGVILFFDEADALFGKRSEVKDSHDRFANIEVNYLLQRMESYRGLAILATNNKRALDTAFLRRLRFVIDFQFPEMEQRRRIWKRIFPQQTPLQGIDYNHLAKLRLTGGNIYNIALNAAFAAANNRPAVDMPCILNAAKSEMIKTQKTLNLTDYQWNSANEVAS